MDRARFDELTRQFGQHRSRRSLLKALGAGILGAGGAVARPDAHDAAAACPPGQVDRRGLGCVCRDTGRPPVQGVCPCPAGQTRCGAICVALGTDKQNCGACGTVCPPDRPYCDGGACVACRTTADCPAAGPCNVVACQAGSCVVEPGPGAPGDACQSATDCCDRPCYQGICRFIPTGFLCTADGQCSSGSCDPGDDGLYCFPNGAGGTCREVADCVTGLCQGGICACSPAGGVCGGAADCCDRPCWQGACRYIPFDHLCSTNAECSSNACQQVDIAFKACAANGSGGFCRANTDCLSGQCNGTACS